MSEQIQYWYYQKYVDGGWKRGKWETIQWVTPAKYNDGKGYQDWLDNQARERNAIYRAISDVGLRLEAEERKVQKGGYDGLPR